ncbi:MAG: SCO family protein [Oligoflexia bacterium]|nr:SCO family protein [Oligoflexia bacterium]
MALVCKLFLLFIFSVLTYSGSTSLYGIGGKWRTTENRLTNVAISKGYPVVIVMIYTSCPHACPMTIAKLKQIESAFHKKGIDEINFVLASFDFEGDKPEKLKEFQRAQKLDPVYWHFLAPESEGDARSLAVALGISYKKISKSDFSHSNVITLLDKEGNILAKIDQLNADIKPIIDGLKK